MASTTRTASLTGGGGSPRTCVSQPHQGGAQVQLARVRVATDARGARACEHMRSIKVSLPSCFMSATGGARSPRRRAGSNRLMHAPKSHADARLHAHTVCSMRERYAACVTSGRSSPCTLPRGPGSGAGSVPAPRNMRCPTGGAQPDKQCAHWAAPNLAHLAPSAAHG